jgi:thiamine biosynthesis lipoprotein ApbE
MVLGPKAGLELLEKQKNVEGFLVDSAGRVYATSGAGDLVRLPAKMELQ